MGTTSNKLIVSELTVENKAGNFTVPEIEILDRKIVYQSPVYFTPLLSESLVDSEGIRSIVEKEYALAGIRRENVDTGAVIITGETSRKENARAVLEALAETAGDFVVATAGPDLESVLAAKGAGADTFSEETGKTVLHMDIGGGTSNLALIRDGKIVATGCLNVGGRLIKLDTAATVTYISPVLEGLCPLKVGDTATRTQVKAMAEILVQALEMAAGLREKTAIFEKLWTDEAGAAWETLPQACAVSFSGGVADCIENTHPWLAFGDMGPILGQEIKNSRLCAGQYRLGSETIRATVIGAGCHSAQLSGSTVFHRNVTFPLKNLPVILLTEQEQAGENAASLIRQRRALQDGTCVLHLPGRRSPDYGWVKALAQTVLQGMEGQEMLVAVENDMAKALGQALAAQMSPTASCLCIDSVKLTEGSFLDVGAPVGPAMPVVVKTLILNQ